MPCYEDVLRQILVLIFVAFMSFIVRSTGVFWHYNFYSPTAKRHTQGRSYFYSFLERYVNEPGLIQSSEGSGV